LPLQRALNMENSPFASGFRHVGSCKRTVGYQGAEKKEATAPKGQRVRREALPSCPRGSASEPVGGHAGNLRAGTGFL